MKLDDLPRTVITACHKERVKYDPKYYAAPIPSEIEAYREMLEQAQEVYRQAVGCIRMMVEAKSSSQKETVERVREIGRQFLKAASPVSFDLPEGFLPTNQRGPEKKFSTSRRDDEKSGQ